MEDNDGSRAESDGYRNLGQVFVATFVLRGRLVETAGTGGSIVTSEYLEIG